MLCCRPPGYRSFFRSQLKPHVHYYPFWQNAPEEAEAAMAWAEAHDREAQAIAAAGQRFVARWVGVHVGCVGLVW